MSKRNARWDSWDRAALGGLLVAAALMLLAAWRRPSPVGMWEDDGVYMSTARALAEGRGYRHIELSGAPFQTKYPILYPLLISLVWRVWPEYPANVFGVVLLNVGLSALAGWIGFRLLRRMCGAPGWIALLATCLWAFNARWSEVNRLAMSEPLFALLALAALYLTEHVAARAAGAAPDSLRARREFVLGLAIGALTGAAYLTRSIGVILIFVAVAALFWRRRWIGGIAATLVAVPCVIGWQLWVNAARAANAAIASAAALAYDLDYSVWRPPTIDQLAWVVGNNVIEQAYALLAVLTQASMSTVLGILRLGEWAAVALALVGLLMLVATIIGLVRARRGGGAICAAFVGVYLLALLSWPFPTWRFLLPVLPLIAAPLALGAIWLASAALRPVGLSQPAGRTGSEWSDDDPAVWLVGAVFALMLFWNGFVVYSQVARAGSDEFEQRLASAAAAIREQTAETAVVACGGGGGLFLATGRQTVPLVPAVRPVASYFPPDRRAWYGGYGMLAGTIAEYKRVLNEDLILYYQQTGVTHVFIPSATGPLGQALNEFVVTNPRFQLLSTAARGALYRFQP